MSQSNMSQPNEYDSIDEFDELDKLEWQEMLEFKKRNERKTDARGIGKTPRGVEHSGQRKAETGAGKC